MRSRKVVGIRGATPIGVKHKDAEVIGELETILTMAREGNIHGIVIGYVTAQRGLITSYAGKADSHDLCAVSAMLAHRIVKLCDHS